MGRFELLLGVVLAAIFVFVSMAFVIDDLGVNYIERNISQASMANQTYDEDINQIESLNNSFAPIFEGVQDISSGDQTFIESLFQGGILLITAIVAFPGAIIALLGSAINIFSTILTEIFYVPQHIQLIGAVGIFIVLLIWIVTWARRFDT